MIGWKPSPFIFVHIPKCAGTSIEKALIPMVTPYRDFDELTEVERTKFWLPGRRLLQHSKLQQYNDHFALKEYFKFAFVRNPWDRAVSQIHYLRSLTGDYVFFGKSFKKNLEIYCSSKLTILGHDLSASQVDYLKDKSGQIQVDFIGRFESLQRDFKHVCKALGIKAIPRLPHIFNSNRVQPYHKFYDKESMLWIKERFCEDIELFEYEPAA